MQSVSECVLFSKKSNVALYAKVFRTLKVHTECELARFIEADPVFTIFGYASWLDAATSDILPLCISCKINN